MEDTALNTKQDLKNWLALLRLPSIGPQKALNLLKYFSDFKGLFDASATCLADLALTKVAIDAIKSPNWDAIDQDIAWAKEPTNNIITWDAPDYPTRLREIANPPLVLFVKGNLKILNLPQLAIVGSRNPTPAGVALAKRFAYQLARCGLTITSGLAIGIDGASHLGALNANGTTIAAMGTGLDRVYPARHSKLAEEIVKNGGTLVSEFLPGTAPEPKNFPRRNRIISGLSLGVLVIEAAVRSGSLITARCANEQGREVFALPGSVHNPLVRGNHALIRQGAKLVESIDDILEELAQILQINEQKQEITTQDNNIADLQHRKGNNTEQIHNMVLDLDQSLNNLLEYVGFDTMSVDEIVKTSGLSVSEVASALSELELKGIIKAVPGGYQRLTDIHV